MPTKSRKPLKPDALVERLLPDPSEPTAATRFVGFLGKSTRPGYWRLYLSPSLNDYLEIADEDILDSHEIEPATSPLGGTVLSVRPTAQVVRKRERVTEARNAFLRGPIATRFLRGSRPQAPISRRAALMGPGGGGGGGLGDHTDQAWGCWLSHIFACASHDPDDPICQGMTELPGTADSCGQCTTEVFCPDPIGGAF